MDRVVGRAQQSVGAQAAEFVVRRVVGAENRLIEFDIQRRRADRQCAAAECRPCSGDLGPQCVDFKTPCFGIGATCCVLYLKVNRQRGIVRHAGEFDPGNGRLRADGVVELPVVVHIPGIGYGIARVHVVRAAAVERKIIAGRNEVRPTWVRDRIILDRLDIQRDGGNGRIIVSVMGAIAETVRTKVVSIGRIGKRSVGTEADRSVQRVSDQIRAERFVVPVTVVSENARCADDQRRVLGNRVTIVTDRGPRIVCVQLDIVEPHADSFGIRLCLPA